MVELRRGDSLGAVRWSLALVSVLALQGESSVQGPVELSFHPAPGSILAKSFEVESSGQLTAARLNEIDLTRMLEGLNEITVESRLRVTDEVIEVGGGRPLELLRDFEEVRTSWGWKDRHEVLHPLLYRSVRFTWDADRRTYDKDWEPRRGSIRPLEGLWEDLDFRCLLPEEPVAVGETWYLSLRRIAPALLPGGSIHRGELLWDEWSLFELEDTLAPRSRHWFRNDDVVCRLEEIVEDQGRSLARVSLRWTWWGLLDLFPEDDEDSWWLQFATHGAIVELELAGHGELLWDIESGHFAAFELEADCEVELELRAEWGRLEVEAEGSAHWSAEAAHG
jgi:hypothetical protein